MVMEIIGSLDNHIGVIITFPNQRVLQVFGRILIGNIYLYDWQRIKYRL